MINSLLRADYYKPVLVYVCIIIVIYVCSILIPKYVLTLASALFLAVPFVMGKGLRLSLNAYQAISALVITVVIISVYLLLFILLTGNSVNISFLSFNLFVTHLLLIAFPEEAFFRGYLQEELGNDIKSIVVVSLLFTIGHLITICFLSGSLGLHCVTVLLTFFPSLVMGYLYFRSKSIWGSVLFHFLANLAYFSTSGYSIFY